MPEAIWVLLCVTPLAFSLHVREFVDNHHLYQLIQATPEVVVQEWSKPNNSLFNASLNGLNGHLLTITSLAERDFILQTFNESTPLAAVALTDDAATWTIGPEYFQSIPFNGSCFAAAEPDSFGCWSMRPSKNDVIWMSAIGFWEGRGVFSRYAMAIIEYEGWNPGYTDNRTLPRCLPGYVYSPKWGCVDFCSSSPCANNGTCSTNTSTYTCQCTPGWTGRQCNMDVNECSTSMVTPVCQNNATCINTAGSYRCQCATGWQGQNCSQDIKECQLQPDICQNGASCTELDGDYRCECPLQWTGKNCSQDVDECAAYQPCRSGATCVNTDGSYTCSCAAGWEGRNCTQDIDECSLVSSICQHGSTCTNTPLGSYTCICPYQWTGINCSQDVDECAAQPGVCGAGRCLNLQGSFACDCAGSGFEGQRCGQDIDECADGSEAAGCGEHAECVDRLGSYECLCEAGYIGDGRTCQRITTTTRRAVASSSSSSVVDDVNNDGEGETRGNASGDAGSDDNNTLLLIAAGGGGGGVVLSIVVFMCLRHRVCCCQGRRGRANVSAIAPLSSSAPSGTDSYDRGRRREQLAVTTLDGAVYDMPVIVQPQYDRLAAN
eukprot:TRINITY_DN10418_c0_g2_i2.p1 TRINITY_DN10418_c0_g2~~TRINITY_DN10418_c0_g2_i2.p1  ORF type:complete len:614 (+),score=65.24 TRINITY_DN10418_c0_g2_i2:26-1843(+)